MKLTKENKIAVAKYNERRLAKIKVLTDAMTEALEGSPLSFTSRVASSATAFIANPSADNMTALTIAMADCRTQTTMMKG